MVWAQPQATERNAASAQAGLWLRAEEAIMGTAVSVELFAPDRAAGEAACAAVLAEMHRIDHAMSPYKAASELSLVNREAPRHAVPVSEELFGLLQRAQAFGRLSQGAFDITYASVGHLYDYRLGVAPDDATVALWQAGIGLAHLQLDARRRTVRFGHPRTRIDLGGFAKGHAVDRATALLAERGIAHAYIAAGGDSRVLGERGGRPWTIAVRHPRRADEVIAVLPLEDCAVSTSGDYERFFERDGVRHHHLIDPRTGRSPVGIASVTVLAADGLTAEALSKTVFVRGIADGLRTVDAFPGVDALVVNADGRLHASPGLLPAGR
jgi:thiamine biosynthesis lipoprotein